MIDPDLKLSFDDAPAVHLVADVVGAAAEAFDYNDTDAVDAAATFVDTIGTAGIMSDVLVLHVLDIPVDAYHRQAFVTDDIAAAVAQVLVQIAAAVAEHAAVVTVLLTDGNAAVPVDVSAASGASVAEFAVLDMVMKAAADVADDIAVVARKTLAADVVAVVVAEAAGGANMIVGVDDAVAAFELAAVGIAVAEDVADTAMSDLMFDHDLLRYVMDLWMRSSCLAYY